MVLELKPRGDTSSLTYTIQNIVVKIFLDIKEDFNLVLLSEKLRNSNYNKDRFPGLFAKFNHPKCAVIIFRNGNLILTGLKSFSHIDLIIERLILSLNKIIQIKIAKELIETQVVNIVITADFGKNINLDKASTKLKNSIYEPEVFPGLTYNVSTPIKSVFLIFSTGKVVLTGIRKEKHIEPILMDLGKLLKKEELFKV
ncbi:MAG: hypothetical protein ACFE8B_06030 [Candidatus Hermodarchaeota archaeon]